MNKTDYFSIHLTKWPALTVVGSEVTREQAAEIIIRTTCLDIFSNAREFQRAALEIIYDIEIPSRDKKYDAHDRAIARKLGLEFTDDSIPFTEVFQYKREREEALGNLPLEYLRNSRIASAWIGGAHGWCNWNGEIFANNYNIGKWPSVEDVYEEWRLIAKAFPFLELRSQLYSGETLTPEAQPVIEFQVKSGKVKMCVPESELVPRRELPIEAIVHRIQTGFSEIGCTLEQLQWALDLTCKKMSEKK